MALALIAVVLAGCGGATAPPSIGVGSGTDPESELVAHLYAAALRFYGSAAHVEPKPDPLAGLDSGDIRVVPGLTGRLIGKLLGYTFKDKRPLPWSEISKVCLGGRGIDNSVGQMCNLLTT